MQRQQWLLRLLKNAKNFFKFSRHETITAGHHFLVFAESTTLNFNVNCSTEQLSMVKTLLPETTPVKAGSWILEQAMYNYQ